MIDQAFRFCPRCGTELVPGEPYCPNCGFNVAGIARPPGEDSNDEPTRDDVHVRDTVRASDQPSRRGMGGSPIVLAAIVVAAGLIGYGLLTRPGPAPDAPTPTTAGSGAPASVVPGTSTIASPPIVGMTIQTPRDGEQVFTKEVTVIGLAPPGLQVTRDVSFRPDQHATADSTGHWAIVVSLDEGENTLVFRIGDDRSTEQRLRVTYTPGTS
jgi:hypothetical protein